MWGRISNKVWLFFNYLPVPELNVAEVHHAASFMRVEEENEWLGEQKTIFTFEMLWQSYVAAILNPVALNTGFFRVKRTIHLWALDGFKTDEPHLGDVLFMSQLQRLLERTL